MRSKAFTLVEVLITLGIIGIVAAITIPNLIHKYYEKQTVSKLKETFSILAQAVRMAEEEYGEAANWEITADEVGASNLANRLKPFLKIAVDCGTVDTEHNCFPDGYYRLLNGKNRNDFSSADRHYKVVLLNGVAMTMAGPTGTTIKNGLSPSLTFFVDVNGKATPNMYGYDTFQFFYYEGLGLNPAGSDSYATTCLASNATGFGCAYYVMNYQTMDYLKQK